MLTWWNPTRRPASRPSSAVGTSSAGSSGAAGWPRCTGPWTAGWAGRSRSSCCAPTSPPTRRPRPASAARPTSAAGLNHPTIVAVYDTGEDVDPVTGVAHPVHRDGAGRGPHPARRAPRRAAAAPRAGPGADRRGAGRARLQPPGRHRAPRHQAGQRDADPDRRGQGDGLRHRPRGGRHRRDHDPDRPRSIGTAQYLSPEQARGETVDARSDLYSAGCLLYELLVGRPPFIGDSPVSVAYQHVRENPVPPSQLDPSLTPDIDAVTIKALAKDPADRYALRRRDAGRHRPAAAAAAGARAAGQRRDGAGHRRDGAGRRGDRRRGPGRLDGVDRRAHRRAGPDGAGRAGPRPGPGGTAAAATSDRGPG